MPVRGAEREREGIHPGIHEASQRTEVAVRSQLPLKTTMLDPRVRQRVYTARVLSSRTNKKERLENCASPVSPGWKPDRKVAGGMVESGVRGIPPSPTARYFYAPNFRVVVSRGELAMLMRRGRKETRRLKAEVLDQDAF